MNPEVAENLLRTAMGEPTDSDFANQLAVLRSQARYKYDAYEQYAPGRQFIAYLARWLQQFDEMAERRSALRFVQERLIYFSDVELRHLVHLMASDRVPAALRRQLSKRLDIPSYRVTQLQASPEFKRAKRGSLFLGMSDGARIDQFRRNDRQLSNEQIAMTYELTPQRAAKMTSQLRKTVGDEEATFDYVFLMDDFAGSGTTILRETTSGAVDGKLPRFLYESLPNLKMEGFPKIFISLYVATEQALHHLNGSLLKYPSPPWRPSNVPEVMAVMTIEEKDRLSHCRRSHEYETDLLFDHLLHKYYDKTLEDEHKGSVVHGYSCCGLPLILPHNTPNNSVYLLWAEQETRALFPRFERHQSTMGGN